MSDIEAIDPRTLDKETIGRLERILNEIGGEKAWFIDNFLPEEHRLLLRKNNDHKRLRENIINIMLNEGDYTIKDIEKVYENTKEEGLEEEMLFLAEKVVSISSSRSDLNLTQSMWSYMENILKNGSHKQIQRTIENNRSIFKDMYYDIVLNSNYQRGHNKLIRIIEEHTSFDELDKFANKKYNLLLDNVKMEIKYRDLESIMPECLEAVWIAKNIIKDDKKIENALKMFKRLWTKGKNSYKLGFTVYYNHREIIEELIEDRTFRREVMHEMLEPALMENNFKFVEMVVNKYRVSKKILQEKINKEYASKINYSQIDSALKLKKNFGDLVIERPDLIQQAYSLAIEGIDYCNIDNRLEIIKKIRKHFKGIIIEDPDKIKRNYNESIKAGGYGYETAYKLRIFEKQIKDKRMTKEDLKLLAATNKFYLPLVNEN